MESMGNSASGERTEEGGSGVGPELTWCYDRNKLDDSY